MGGARQGLKESERKRLEGEKFSLLRPDSGSHDRVVIDLTILYFQLLGAVLAHASPMAHRLLLF